MREINIPLSVVSAMIHFMNATSNATEIEMQELRINELLSYSAGLAALIELHDMKKNLTSFSNSYLISNTVPSFLVLANVQASCSVLKYFVNILLLSDIK